MVFSQGSNELWLLAMYIMYTAVHQNIVSHWRFYSCITVEGFSDSGKRMLLQQLEDLTMNLKVALGNIGELGVII